MYNIAKGALAMVLVGSVTFSVTNALLADHSTNQSAHAAVAAHSENRKTADNINQTKKTVNNQSKKTTDNIQLAVKSLKVPQTLDGTQVQAVITENDNALQPVSYHGNNDVTAIQAIQSNTAASSAEEATSKTIAAITNHTASSGSVSKGTTTTS